MNRTERRVMLGKVSVDSGQLLIIDPCYIDGMWRRPEDSHVVGVAFWGADADKVAEELKGHPSVASLESSPGNRYVATPHMTGDRPSAPVFGALCARMRELTVSRRFAWERVLNSSYADVCNLTLGPDQGGALSDLLAVAFSSGWGDGTYDVWATYKDMGRMGGERVTKVEVILISDELEEA